MTSIENSRYRRLCSIPPRIRALAKVIHDVDKDDFPLLYFQTGDVNDQEVFYLATQLGRKLKSKRDVEDFHYAFNDYAKHLKEVNLEELTRAGLTELITLSTNIDREAIYTNFTSQDLNAVYYTHHLLLEVPRNEISTRLSDVFTIFTRRITNILYEILWIVQSANKQQSGASYRKGNLGDEYRSKQFSNDETITVDVMEECSLSLYDSYKSFSSTYSREFPLALTIEEENAKITELNSTLWFITQHLEWFIGVSKKGKDFDASEHISDVSALEVWCKFIGNNCPACSREKFEPALAVFPDWAITPLLNVLDYQNGGVISVYTLQRLLKIWGPFLLLDRNLSYDLSHGIINLTETTDVLALKLDTESTAGTIRKGAFALTISKTHGALDLIVVSGADRRRKSTTVKDNPSVCDPTSKAQLDSPISLRTILLDRSTGSWILNGVSKEDFETPTDACRAFPQVFSKPYGEVYEVPNVLWTSETNDIYSILHRTCFRNNIAYVNKLIDRGGGIIANSAMKDPMITMALTWTPLLCAANNPNGDPWEITAVLLANGADALYCDEATCTAIYYTIVNRYGKSLQILLEHCRERGLEPFTSSSTVPLFVALGAHFLNISDLDNFRLCDCIPSVGIVRRLLLYCNNWDIVKAAIDILEKKLLGEDVTRSFPGWNFMNCPVPILTPIEKEREREAVAHHTLLCSLYYTLDVLAVLRVLYDHSMFLSCRQLVSELREECSSNPQFDNTVQ